MVVVKKLAVALRKELEMLLGHRDTLVWLDEDFIEIGNPIGDLIKKAICESVCMIVIYTPTTFEEDHSWCAREYVAMKVLEETRLNALNKQVKRPQRDLILPIIYRGNRKDVLLELRDRNPCLFESVLPELNHSLAFATEIPKIAKYISEWCNIFHEYGVGVNADDSCDDFELPEDDDEQVANILRMAKTLRPRFPGR